MAASLFRYVALGDSTGVGVGSQHDGGYPERLYQRLKGAGIKAGIMNLAQSGATSADLLSGPVHKAVEVRPALITLGIGTNDLWRLVPVSTFEMNLKVIGKALEQTGAKVVVSNLIDLGRAPIAVMIDSMLRIPRAMFIQRIEAFNAAIGSFSKRPNFSVVDLFSLSTRSAEDFNGLFASDGFHPSAKGYERWTQELWPHVEAAARAWKPQSGE